MAYQITCELIRHSPRKAVAVAVVRRDGTEVFRSRPYAKPYLAREDAIYFIVNDPNPEREALWARIEAARTSGTDQEQTAAWNAYALFTGQVTV